MSGLEWRPGKAGLLKTLQARTNLLIGPTLETKPMVNILTGWAIEVAPLWCPIFPRADKRNQLELLSVCYEHHNSISRSTLSFSTVEFTWTKSILSYNICPDISLKTIIVNHIMAQEATSGDHQSQEDSSSWDYQCLYQNPSKKGATSVQHFRVWQVSNWHTCCSFVSVTESS